MDPTKEQVVVLPRAAWERFTGSLKTYLLEQFTNGNITAEELKAKWAPIRELELQAQYSLPVPQG